MQCHNHPWERAEAVAKSAAAGKRAGHTHTHAHRARNTAMLCSQGERIERPWGATVQPNQRRERRKGVSRRKLGNTNLPEKHVSHRVWVLRHKPKRNDCLLPKAANAFNLHVPGWKQKTPNVPPQGNFTKKELRQHTSGESGPSAKSQSRFWVTFPTAPSRSLSQSSHPHPCCDVFALPQPDTRQPPTVPEGTRTRSPHWGPVLQTAPQPRP